MMLQIDAIVRGVLDSTRRITFWSEALNDLMEREPDSDFAILIPKEGAGVPVSLNKITGCTLKRQHLDVFTRDQAGKEVQFSDRRGNCVRFHD